MRVVTERALIRDVAANWRKQYRPYSQHTSDKREIGRKLNALDGETATAEDVLRIIGNDSWTKVPDCEECGAVSPLAVVEIGREPDYESRTAYVCATCLHNALGLIVESVATRPTRDGGRGNGAH